MTTARLTKPTTGPTFKKAERTQLKARIALDGPSGSGKTFSGLRCAYAFGGRVAVIDTEHRAASKYAGEQPDAIRWDFDVMDLTNYDPSNYIAAIETADREGYDTIFIDSLSHSWMGKGGALDMVDNSGEKNSYFAWKNVTPVYREMIDCILRSKCHVIATLRTKTEYAIEKDDRGRNIPVKIGLAPVIRDGIEYEFDVVGDMDLNNTLHISKTRCSAMRKAVCDLPGPLFWNPLIEWLAKGTPIQPADQEQLARITELIETLQLTPDQFSNGLKSNLGITTVAQLTTQTAEQLIDLMEKKLTA